MSGGAQGLEGDGIHHRLDLAVAGGGVHPDLLHAGRDRRALPRVRGRGLARDHGLGGGVAHAHSAAGIALPAPRAARTTRRFAGRRGSSAIFRWTLARYAASLDWCLRHRAVVLRRRPGLARRHGGALHHHPEGLLPDRGPRADHRRRPRRSRTSPSPRCRSCCSGWASASATNPAVDTVIVNASDSNTGRLFLNLKPRGEREPMEKVLEELRRDDAPHPRRERVLQRRCRTCAWAGASARRATSTC